MSPVGHTLTGLAIGWFALPAGSTKRGTAIAMSAYVVLANAPDLPLPMWGHDRYHISHSLISTTVGVAVVSLLAGLCSRFLYRIPGRLILAGAAAWYSHILLDTYYNHGIGLPVGWPISEARIALPIPCFSTISRNPIIGWHNVRVVAVEALVYGSILAAVVYMKFKSTHKSVS